jgi:site-specific DNA-methyltransferase (adenine-specific)
LPYGTTFCDWDAVIPFENLWIQYNRVLKPAGSVLLFSCQPFTTQVISSNLKDFRYCWYWTREKGTGFLNARRQPLRVVEEVCVFYRKATPYHPIMVPLEKPYRHTLPRKNSATLNVAPASTTRDGEREYKDYTHRYPTNLLHFPRDRGGKSLVPTQKPLALLEYMVQTFTQPGDVVLDNTMGSGTCGVACRKLDRRFIGIEKNPDHYAIARDRILATAGPAAP